MDNKKARLDFINFEWNLRTPTKKEFLQELELYKYHHGHLDVPQHDVNTKTKSSDALVSKFTSRMQKINAAKILV